MFQETEKLESEQAKLQDDIKAFQREKDELEFILEAHRLHCGIGESTGAAAAEVTTATTGSELKFISSDSKVVVVVAGSPAGSAHSSAGPSQSSTGSAHLSVDSTSSSSTTVTVKSEEKVAVARRPNSLVTPHLIGGAGPQVAGVSITTPSAGINVYTLGLESMLDGHTGLTPITGLPVSLTGISTPIFAIPASVTGVPVDESATPASSTTSSAV